MSVPSVSFRSNHAIHIGWQNDDDEYEPTEAELDAMIAEQLQCLPEWWWYEEVRLRAMGDWMRLLDLFCGAGGCAVGYSRAGFSEIVGVDIKPQPRYPFAFVQGDALEYLAAHGHEFDAIHASPPCQRFSQAQRLQGREHADLLTPTISLLATIKRHWVVENVVGAPMPNAVTLCGLTLGIAVKRHRLFAASFPLSSPSPCPKGHPGEWYTVFGGGAPRSGMGRRAGAKKAAAAMGIDWMTRDELSQAIPPAYTAFIGKQLIAAISGGAK